MIDSRAFLKAERAQNKEGWRTHRQERLEEGWFHVCPTRLLNVSMFHTPPRYTCYRLHPLSTYPSSRLTTDRQTADSTPQQRPDPDHQPRAKSTFPLMPPTLAPSPSNTPLTPAHPGTPAARAEAGTMTTLAPLPSRVEVWGAQEVAAVRLVRLG